MGQQLFLDSSLIAVNEKDIQGYILVGLQKKAELFIFFKIVDEVGFRKGLATLTPQFATVELTRRYEEAAAKAAAAKAAGKTIQASPDLTHVTKINIAFSSKGLDKLGMPHAGADPSFEAGMEKNASLLGDELSDWHSPYLNRQIHGVLLIAAWNEDINNAETMALNVAQSAMQHFGASAIPIVQEMGSLNRQSPGHEMFGFADGVSQPAVDGLHKPVTDDDQSFPGQDIVKLGDYILGSYDQEKGGKATPSQSWMENGSYMVFRRLQQDVAGFNKFTAGNFKGFADSADQFAAKLIGRWKDGSPLARDPLRPNPEHGEERPFENNDFEFGVQKVAQKRCPFNAHIRRVYPRSDIQDGVGNAEHRRIIRAGIAFDNSAVNTGDQGLLFVCYQSSIEDKFKFIQADWANQNSISFVPGYNAATQGQLPAQPGIDLIIGQAQTRSATWDGGAHLANVPRFVTATGGEYFFMPSITGLVAMTK